MGSQEKSSDTEVDVAKLGAKERHVFIENLIKDVERDNLQLLKKQRDRKDRVNITLPTIEVQYKNLHVEAECEVVRGKPLPTLWNSTKRIFSRIAVLLDLKPRVNKSILNNVSGIVKPSRMTLLLGPPGSGKTTLLLTLAGKRDRKLKVLGEVSYNGFQLNEFVPEKTAAYISQSDLHIPEMTVRETLDFSCRLQGVGKREEILNQVRTREEQAGIVPDNEIQTYMKAISVEGLDQSLQTDYIIKIMGLDTCAEVIAGDAMRRGISEGQKKRLTTGEMIVGPTKTFFMDEISAGLDSSTTFQIVTCLQQLCHISEATIMLSLLQPAPEIYDLFDDIILMAEGKIAYHGPRSEVLEFFEECGFRCPERKGAADFLQEVLSKKDQEQYWFHIHEHYNYISVDEFSKKFQASRVGQRLHNELSLPSDKSQSNKDALSFNIYSLPKTELFKACMAREFLLMKRNSFVYTFKTTQLTVIAFIAMTMFMHNRKAVDARHASKYLGSLFYAFILLMFNGFPEMAMTVPRLPVFYKQRDFHFYPAWAYAIPSSILKIPISFAESLIWTSLTYYVIGYSPEPERFFKQFLLFFLLHQMALSLFRFLASYFETAPLSTFAGNVAALTLLTFGGFVLPRPYIPIWLRWCFWTSPLTYAEIGLSGNEFLAPRWQKISSGNVTIGQEILLSRGLNFKSYFYWVSVGALLGYILLFNIAFTLALTFKSSIRKSRTIISRQTMHATHAKDHEEEHSNNFNIPLRKNEEKKTGRMILAFAPLAITFHNIQYYVDTPQEMRQNRTEKQLQLLQDITGAFRPGILSALMGISGAGKTTLLDVLSGRKTGGTIEGEIRIGGHPKVQGTFARISGYCEQNDIHSPQITVEESVRYSAWLRLPSQVDCVVREEFVREVLEIVELDGDKDALVGIPGISGLSNEQRKRLTIAVELVANPSIIFMDEPTTGMDARAAAIVMRAVKNISETGRTIVCTIHQPSIDIFEVFDELILLKIGGKMMYCGPLGRHSSALVEYFEGIEGVPQIKGTCNPATWMLGVTSTASERQLGIDFASIYRESPLYIANEELVKNLSMPSSGSTNLKFPTRFRQNSWVQFKACLWKQYLSYWRSPTYNLARILYTTIASITFALLFWKHGKTMDSQQQLLNMIGSMYVALMSTGINNCSTVIPFVAVERTVLYRERFAGMYSSWAYSLAQVVIEIPYVFVQTALLVAITYSTICSYWSTYKFCWFFYTTFCTLLYFVYYGMLLVSLTPTVQVASVLASLFYQIQNLVSGFVLPRPQIPNYWIWLHYISPLSWTLRGLFITLYADLDKEMIVSGETISISKSLEEYFGLNQTQLAPTAAVLITFPVIFALLFSFFTGKLNFQNR